MIRAEQPDSAFALLDGITNPDILNDKTFARFCLIHAGLSEQLGEDMPFVPQMERANDYYEKHGSLEEKMNCLMYLGMSYEEETDFDWAMKSYLKAVEMAKKANNYLLVGKLYKKIAGLHDYEDNYDEAQRYHLLSGEYYLKGGDSLDYIYSIRDIGWLYTLKEEYGEASESYQKAYQLALNMNDSLLLSSMTNRLGINYKELGDYSLAEKYLYQSIAYDEAGSAPTYLALADLYTRKKEYGKVREYIEMASMYRTPGHKLTGGLLFRLYILEKEQGNYSLSLDYYEQYVNYADSIADLQARADVLKVERRYEYAELLNNNNELENRNQWIIIACVLLLLVSLFLLVLYKYRITLKNEYILNQQKRISEANKALQEKEFAVKGLKGDILNIRENILRSSAVYKKIIKNSQSIEEAKKYPLTDQDWLTLKEILKTTYFLFIDNLQSQIPNLTEDEIRFCCLLKIGLNSQQLSILLNIQSASVSHKRYRIMKKGQLENTDITLEKFVFGL
ncbi:tetratricopeptide repeat protein [Parabacteroides goldsteinii]|uniref:tetratricopeptide repeat protein n=1 Tax=Parabacteroides goldsteinii TaxID=328812 RepID=UPI002A7F0952|nr:tetratricopeptide repeat protein [Parabacteroides goldsteinii]